MTVKNDVFEFNAKGYWYTFDDNYTVTKSGCLINEINSFDKFKLILGLNRFPMFEFSLKIIDWMDFIGLKHIHFYMKLYKEHVIDFDGTIIKMDPDKDYIKFTGYLGKPEQIFKPISRFLGVCWKGSVEYLGGLFGLSYDHSYRYCDPTEGFYVINETPKEAFLRILSAAGNDYQYYIGTDKFKVFKACEATCQKEVKRTMMTYKLKMDDNLEKVKHIIHTEPTFSQYAPSNGHEITMEHYYRPKCCCRTHKHYEKGGIKSWCYNKKYNRNLMDNVIWSEGYQVRTIYKINKFLNVDVGQTVKYPIEGCKCGKKWIILAKQLILTVPGIETILELGNQCTEFK